MKWEHLNSGVRVTRWVMESPAPPFFQKAGGFKPDQKCRPLQIIDWTPPSFVRLDVGCAISGTGARDGNRSQGINDAQPECDHARDRPHDALFRAQAHNFKTDKKWVTDLLFENVHTAFLEDLRHSSEGAAGDTRDAPEALEERGVHVLEQQVSHPFLVGLEVCVRLRPE